MSMRYLVTGANGHLGNNLVRELANRGKLVGAGIRDMRNTMPFNGLNLSSWEQATTPEPTG